MQIFYLSSLTKGRNTLSPEESHHLTRVLRMKKGEAVGFIDGMGGFGTGLLQEADPKASIVDIHSISREHNKRPYRLHIAIAPTKNINRFEWFLEKSTEIGIDEITPLLCDRSERKKLNIERLQKQILSAMKQSKNAYMPSLNPLTSYANFMAKSVSPGKTGSLPQATELYIAHLDEKLPPVQLMDQNIKEASSLILIGPEGDFSDRELEMAAKAGYKQVIMGNNRLRTETAGIIACHTVGLVNL